MNLHPLSNIKKKYLYENSTFGLFLSLSLGLIISIFNKKIMKHIKRNIKTRQFYYNNTI